LEIPKDSEKLRPAILGPVHVHGLSGHLSRETLALPLPAGMGGYCINSLIEARLRRGWRTDVVTLDPAAREDLTRLEGPLLRIWVVRRRTSGAVRDLFAVERRLLMAAVAESEPDLIHANWTYEYGLTAARQRRYPYLLTVHDHARHCLRWLGWRFGGLYVISQYVLRRSRHLTAVSPYVGDGLEKTLRRRVPVVPNLVSAAAWELGRVRAGTRSLTQKAGVTVRVVSAINWSDLKNARGALLAFRLARQLCVEQAFDLQYTLMGPGLGPGGPAESWAARQDCKRGVVFKGSVGHEEALREIAGSDVLFHPSHEEAMPGPVCEAMAMRVPVVACREAGGSRWLCGDGRGFLCDGHDPRQMAERLVEACVQPCDPQCAAANAWLAGLASEDSVLNALALAYGRACGTRG
jgi:glycosyltransferase involved in cell wall biosynthesis